MSLQSLYAKYGNPLVDIKNLGGAINQGVIQPAEQLVNGGVHAVAQAPQAIETGARNLGQSVLGGLGDAAVGIGNTIQNNPVLNTMEGYGQNQILNPIVNSIANEAVNPNFLNAVGVPLGIVRGIYDATPLGVAQNAAISGVSSAIQAARTGSANVGQNFVNNQQISTGLGMQPGLASDALDLGANLITMNPEGVAGSVKNLGNLSKDAGVLKNAGTLFGSVKQLAGIHDAPLTDASGAVVKDANGNVVRTRVSPTFFGEGTPVSTTAKQAINNFVNHQYSAPGFAEVSGNPLQGAADVPPVVPEPPPVVPPPLAPDRVIGSFKNAGNLLPETDAQLPQSYHEQRNLDAAVQQMSTIAHTNPAQLDDIIANGTADQKTSALIAKTNLAGEQGDAAQQLASVTAASEHGIDVGRGTQAFAQVDPDSALGAGLLTQRSFNEVSKGQEGAITKAASAIQNTVEANAKLNSDEVATAAQKAAEGITNEATQKPATVAAGKVSTPRSGKVNTPTGRQKPTTVPSTEDVAQKPVESLSKRIISHVKGPGEPKPKSQLVNELYRIAKQTLPPTKQRAAAQSAIERINQVFLEDEENPEVYERAKEQVLEKFKGNTDVKNALDAYEKSEAGTPPIAKSTLTQAVKDEFKKSGQNLADLVKNTPKSGQAEYEQYILSKMKEQGYSSEAGQAFLKRFRAEVENQVQAKRTSAIRQLAQKAKPSAQATYNDKLNKLSNLGVLSNSDYLDLAKEKLGIPTLTTKMMRDIDTKTQAIQEMPDGEYGSKEWRAKNNARSDMYTGIAKTLPSSLFQKGLAVFKAGILSAPHIADKVVPSHVINAALEALNDQVAGKVIDPLVGMVTKRRGTVGTASGTLTGLKQGFHNALDLMLKGRDPNASPEQILHGSVNMGKSWVGRGLQAYVDFVRRVHGVVPAIGEASASLRNLYDQAETVAHNQGLSGDDAGEFIRNYVANPSKEALEEAHYHGQRTALTNPTSVSNYIERGQKGSPTSKVVNPIVRVPAAAAGAVLDYSPVGFLKSAVKAGIAIKKDGELTRQNQALLSRGIGRATIGSGIIAGGVAAGKAGLVSNRSKTSSERALKQSQGIPDNAIKIPGTNTWVNDTSLGPLGADLDMGGAFNQGLQNTKKTPGSFAQAAGSAALSGAYSQLNQPIFSGFTPIADAINDPNRSLKSFAVDSAKSLVPGVVADAASVLDPNQRISTDTVGHALQSTIPFLRNNLPVKNSILGQPLANPGYAGNILSNPDAKTAANNPALQELIRLNSQGLSAVPAPLGTTVSSLGVLQNLTPDQQSELQGIRGKAYNTQIAQLINSPEYQALSDADKAEAIKKTQALVDAQTSLNYSVTHSLSQTNQGGIGQTTTQKNDQLKLQAAQAYASQDGAGFYSHLSQIPSSQQTAVSNEIKAAFGDTVYGKQPGAANQVIKSLQPAIVGPDAGQVGAANYVNNFAGFQNKRSFEVGPDPSHPNNPDHDPIYDLTDDQAKEVLLARSQSVDGQSTPLAKTIKNEDWYKAYAPKETAYFDNHPQPLLPGQVQNPLMSDAQKEEAAAVAALPTSAERYAYYQTPAGKDLQSFYNALNSVDATKLQTLGATQNEVAIAQLAQQNQSSDVAKATAAIANGTQNSGNVFYSGGSHRISSGARRASAKLGKVSHARIASGRGKVHLAVSHQGRVKVASVKASRTISLPKIHRLTTTNA